MYCDKEIVQRMRYRVKAGQSTAFTLIELLVVIAIISILVAILLPTLAKAKTAVRMTGSLSQMRQIQTAMHMYIGDNNGVLPGCLRDSTSPYIYWSQRLVKREYIKQPLKIFWSPGRDTSFLSDYASAHPGQTPVEVFRHFRPETGYSANHIGAMPQDSYGQLWGLYPVTIYQPGLPASKLMTLTEAYSRGQWTTNHYDGWYTVDANTPNPTGGAGLFTYDGNVVTGYLDGHAKAVKDQVLGWIAKGPHDGVWKSNTVYNRTKAPWYYHVFTER